MKALEKSNGTGILGDILKSWSSSSDAKGCSHAGILSDVTMTSCRGRSTIGVNEAP